VTVEPGSPANTDYETGTPAWWLRRLESELGTRIDTMQAYRDLVDDAHQAPDSAETSRKFRRISGLSTTNLTGLAVEATAERMSIEGIRIGDEPDADKQVWDDIWQGSNFDEGSQDAITSALVYSRSFVSVEPPTSSDGAAKLHYEDPRQVVLATWPDGSRRAALKVFTDEWTGTTFGTLYTPNYLVKMERAGTPGAQPYWVPRDMGREAPVVRNPLGEVPFFELQNRLTGSIRSEVAPLVIPQLRLNQVIFNTDAVAEYGAFRQKWATGIEVPRDSSNRPIAPYEPNVQKLLVAEGHEARFGDFNVSDMKPYIDLAQEIAAHIARLSRVPITYFLNNVSNLSADALALLVSGLVLKCQRRVKGYEPAFEGAVRLALRTMNDSRANAANIEVKWAEMETRSMAQAADAAVKLTTGDNPVITPQTAQEKWLGMSQTERDRDEAWRESASARDPMASLAATLSNQSAVLPATAGDAAEQ
jgi:Phage portal protein, SPP1 Gp6-like